MIPLFQLRFSCNLGGRICFETFRCCGKIQDSAKHHPGNQSIIQTHKHIFISYCKNKNSEKKKKRYSRTAI